MYTHIPFVCLFSISLAVYPFDPPFYNLIDVTPNCYPMGLCTEYGEWGKSMDSIHPSPEERTLHIIRNMARLYPSDFKESKYGVREWGYKGNSWEWHDNGYCGQAAEYPVYWYSMGNQASRFHAYDKFTCDDSIGHETCSNPNRCDRFGGSCSFGTRSRTFVPTGGIWGKSEGIYNMNSAYNSGHCSAIFDPDYKYWGIGYWPSMSSSTTLYIKNGPPRDYPIYMAAHFDETSKIASTYYNANGKHLTFLMGWYGNADTIGKQASKAYVLYAGGMHEMKLIFGNRRSGIYEAHFDYPQSCEPYAFLVETTDATMYRLPEEELYFYGTAWVELEKGVPNKAGIDYAACNENHYFKDERQNNQWIANGARNITKRQITFINHNECQGCAKVSPLESVYNTFVATGNVPVINGPPTGQPIQTQTTQSNQPGIQSNNDQLGVCETSGDRGYEVQTLFKIRIKSESDQQEKDDSIQQHLDEILADNADCNDYTTNIEETWVRTKRLEVTITVCFHCVDPNAGAFIQDEDGIEVEEQADTIRIRLSSTAKWILFAAGCCLVFCLICCVAACVACHKRQKGQNSKKSAVARRVPSQSSLFSPVSMNSNRVSPLSNITDDEEEQVNEGDECFEFGVTKLKLEHETSPLNQPQDVENEMVELSLDYDL